MLRAGAGGGRARPARPEGGRRGDAGRRRRGAARARARPRRARPARRDEDHPLFGQGRRRQDEPLRRHRGARRRSSATARSSSPPTPRTAWPTRSSVAGRERAHARSRPNLDALEIDVNRELASHWGVIQEWLTRFMTFQGVDEAVAEEMAILPGMEELFSLLKVKGYAEAKAYDVIVIDTRAHRRDGPHAGRARDPELLLQAHLPHPAHGAAVGAAGGQAHDRHAAALRRRAGGGARRSTTSSRAWARCSRTRSRARSASSSTPSAWSSTSRSGSTPT